MKFRTYARRHIYLSGWADTIPSKQGTGHARMNLRTAVTAQQRTGIPTHVRADPLVHLHESMRQ